MDENILMKNLYKHSIENIEETYKELYSDLAWKENTDKYSKAITFQAIVESLVKLKMINLSVDKIYPTNKGSHEFYAVLKRV